MMLSAPPCFCAILLLGYLLQFLTTAPRGCRLCSCSGARFLRPWASVAWRIYYAVTSSLSPCLGFHADCSVDGEWLAACGLSPNQSGSGTPVGDQGAFGTVPILDDSLLSLVCSIPKAEGVLEALDRREVAFSLDSQKYLFRLAVDTVSFERHAPTAKVILSGGVRSSPTITEAEMEGADMVVGSSARLCRFWRICPKHKDGKTERFQYTYNPRSGQCPLCAKEGRVRKRRA